MAILGQRRIVASSVNDEIRIAGIRFKKGILTDTWVDEETFVLINAEVSKGNIIIFEYGTGEGGGTAQPVDLTELTDIRTDIRGNVFESAVKRIENDYIELSNLFMMPYMNKNYKYYIGNKIVTTNNTIKGTSTRLNIRGQITKDWISRANLIEFPTKTVNITECSYSSEKDKLIIERIWKRFSGEESLLIGYNEFPISKLKIATTYTLSLKTVQNSRISHWLDICLYSKDSSGTVSKKGEIRFNTSDKTNYNSISFSTPINLEGYSYALRLEADVSSGSFVGPEPYKGVCELMLVEGKYGSSTLPDFVPYSNTKYACLGEDDDTDGTDGYTITMRTTSETGEVSLSSVRLAEPLRAMPDDLRFGEAGYDYIQGDTVIRNIGEREYQEGDDGDSSVFTDGKRTLYVRTERKIERLSQPFNIDTFDGVNTIECLNTLNPFFSLCVPVGEQYTDIDKLKEDIEYLKQAILRLSNANAESMIRPFTDSVLLELQTPLKADISESMEKTTIDTSLTMRTYAVQNELLTGNIPLGLEESIGTIMFGGIDLLGFSEIIESTETTTETTPESTTEGDETNGTSGE